MHIFAASERMISGGEVRVSTSSMMTFDLPQTIELSLPMLSSLPYI